MIGLEDFTPYYQVIIYIMTALVGLCVGSFLNVVIYRVPLGMSLAKPASHCPKCGYELKWYDNIPILSYIMLGGKCRSCKEHISFRYTIVEFGHMLLWVLSLYVFRTNLLMAALVALSISICFCITFIDLEHMIIPDRFQVMMLVLGIAVIVLDLFYNTDKEWQWYDHLIGAAIGGGLFFGVGALFKVITKVDSLGGGDIKFAFVAGLFLGWAKFIIMIIISTIIAIILMVFREKDENGNSKEFPFGPFLAIGFLVAALFGDLIFTWYICLFI